MESYPLDPNLPAAGNTPPPPEDASTGLPVDHYVGMFSGVQDELSLRQIAGNVIQQLLQEFVDESEQVPPTNDKDDDIRSTLRVLDAKESKWKAIAYGLVAQNVPHVDEDQNPVGGSDDAKKPLVAPEAFRAYVQTEMPELHDVWWKNRIALRTSDSLMSIPLMQ